MKVWRCVDTAAGRAAWNMAVDEALLEGYQAGDPPVFRLYGWSPAAISLGRFQPWREVSPPPGVELVRRRTGGAAIYHREDELTYSVVAPYALFGKGPKPAYRAIHAAIRQALVGLGVDFAPSTRACAPARPHGLCFDQATDYDIVVGARKLVGSAQRRCGSVFLQHGSIPVSPDPLTEGAVSLAELLPAPPTRDVLVAALLEAVAVSQGVEIRHDALRDSEQNRANALVRERYEVASWTQER